MTDPINTDRPEEQPVAVADTAAKADQDPITRILNGFAYITDLLKADSTPGETNQLRKGAVRMRQLALIDEAMKKVKKITDDEYDRLRLKVLPEIMMEDGIKTTVFEGVGRVQLGGDIYASIPADKREEAYKWLREKGDGDLIQETVNSSTLKAYCKEKMQTLAANGEELPDCFKVQPYSRVSIVKVK